MKANEVIRKVLDEHGEITEVYWVCLLYTSASLKGAAGFAHVKS